MISFIIPTLNEEKTIEETLRLLQLYKGSYEVIISDGGSTDKTLEIARKYTASILEHREIHRQTIAEGRNVGAFSSCGQYIVEMDADTHFPDINNFFDTIIKKFEDDPKIVGATTWFRVYPQDETLLDKLIFSISGFFSLVMNNYFKLSSTSGGEFQMMRADAFREIGGYNKEIVSMEDNEMFSRLRTKGYIYFANDLYIYHSGRRAHILGWPYMIGQFILNSFFLLLFKKTANKVWKVVR
jgi:glycosyltransferase involved in cell wall biosynthesis